MFDCCETKRKRPFLLRPSDDKINQTVAKLSSISNYNYHTYLCKRKEVRRFWRIVLILCLAFLCLPYLPICFPSFFLSLSSISVVPSDRHCKCRLPHKYSLTPSRMDTTMITYRNRRAFPS